MVETYSNPVTLGTKAPNFTQKDTLGNEIALEHIKSNIATVVMFICNHCPFVQHILPTIIKVAKYYQQKGVTFVAINANDSEHYPEDSPEKMAIVAHNLSFPFPYLFDDTQEIAKAYEAACTPDFFIYDQHLKLEYHGQFDASTPGNSTPVTGDKLSQALDLMLSGKPILEKQLPSVGCNIKWK